MEIRETQIEDVLVNAPVLTKQILSLDDEPRLIGRQMQIPSGRLDMLYAYRSKFLLIELKTVAFQRRFLQQVLNYRQDLIEFQRIGKLLKGDIEPFLLCPFMTKQEKGLGQSQGVACFDYNPEEILKYFYENFRPVASFVKTKPIDIGIWNLHLVNKFIYRLQTIRSLKSLQKIVGGSRKTLYNKMRFAKELRLIDWEPNTDHISLTELGEKYVQSRDAAYPDGLSDQQADLIKRFVVRSPFESPVVLGVASVVEATFALSKNIYPVPMAQLCEYFTYHSGKVFDWKTTKAKYSATRMYSNYAVDLGLLAKTEQSVYLTPEGFKFTIQMQLHKSLRLMETLVVN